MGVALFLCLRSLTPLGPITPQEISLHPAGLSHEQTALEYGGFGWVSTAKLDPQDGGVVLCACFPRETNLGPKNCFTGPSLESSPTQHP
jgi:hypothetical protein